MLLIIHITMGQAICGNCGEFNFHKNEKCRKCGSSLPEEKHHANYIGREH